MKEKGRILGIDDGPFSRSVNKFTSFVGVLMRLDGRIEGVRIDRIPVDGNTAEEKIIEMVESIGPDNINVIMSEGVTFAGFDIVNPADMYGRTGIPYISATRAAADMSSMEEALAKYGEVGKIRKLRTLRPVRCMINNLDFVVNYSGIMEGEALNILGKSLFVGNVPEPVRIAHMISEAVFQSQSQ